MKSLLSILFICNLALSVSAQCDSLTYNALIYQGESLQMKGKFGPALNKYNSAQTVCKSRYKEAREHIARMFVEINELKDSSDARSTRAINSEIRAKASKADADAQLNIAKKLAKYLYFNEYGWAKVGRAGNFFFINHNGDSIRKLRSWDTIAVDFDQIGLARGQLQGMVWSNNYIDTAGNTYPVFYSIGSLKQETKISPRTALDLRNASPPEGFDSIPELSQLKILRFNRTGFDYLNNRQLLGDLKALEYLDMKGCEMKTLPNVCYTLTTVKYLDLSDSWLGTLTSDIGKMNNLLLLDLRRTHIAELPAEIAQLKKLRILRLSDEFTGDRGKLQRMLPNCKIKYDNENL